MTRKRDELQFLQRAWNSLKAPELARELAHEDEPTRVAVTWLQTAYRSAVPKTQRKLTTATPSVFARTAALAIAASVLALFAHMLSLIATAPRIETASAKTAAPTPNFDPLKNQLELRSGPVRLVFLGGQN